MQKRVAEMLLTFTKPLYSTRTLQLSSFAALSHRYNDHHQSHGIGRLYSTDSRTYSYKEEKIEVKETITASSESGQAKAIFEELNRKEDEIVEECAKAGVKDTILKIKNGL
jgi:hypothetical protein